MMGLFGSLKKVFNHGGVKIELSAPNTISRDTATLPVTVTVLATDQAQTINRVSIEIIATSQNESFSTNTNNFQNQNNTVRTVARMDNTDTFNLTPGESKTVLLSLSMNGGIDALMQAVGLDPDSTVGKVAGELIGLIGNAGSSSYSYSLRASADVANIKLDPAKEQPLHILAPGQIGTNFNVQL